MAPALQVLFAFLGLCLAFWLLSAAVVLLSPLPSDPWRETLPPKNSEYIRVSDGAALFMRHWLPAGHARAVVLALHGLGKMGYG